MAGLALIVLGLATSVAIVRAGHDGTASSGGDGSTDDAVLASCADAIVFSGNTYFANGAKLHLTPGESLAGAERVGCRDSDEGPDTGPKEPSEAAASQIEGVDERIAIMTSEPGSVYVAGGRCAGFEDPKPLERCLRAPLEFRSSRYVETRLLEPVTTGDPLGSGRRQACCGLSGEVVSVAEVHGGNANVVVADARDPTTVFIAVDECVIDEEEELRACFGKS